MNKNLLVTVADADYVPAAKQLFSSVYFNAGWKGDYMLLSYEIPEEELKWFRDKGILVKECKLSDTSYYNFHPTYLCRYHLFTHEFRKWKNILFLDADIIVRASLDKLTEIKGLAAPSNTRLENKLISPLHARLKNIDEKIFKEFKSKYDLNKPTFCSGVMAFDTGIIKDDTFSRLTAIFKRYCEICTNQEEFALILLFNDRCEKLPLVYNIIPYYMPCYNISDPREMKGIIIHFCKEKPWITGNYFYKEWKDNLDKADLIALKRPLRPKVRWTAEEIREYDLYLKKNRTRYFNRYIFKKTRISLAKSLDEKIGLAGLVLKKYVPGLYFKLTKSRED